MLKLMANFKVFKTIYNINFCISTNKKTIANFLIFDTETTSFFASDCTLKGYALGGICLKGICLRGNMPNRFYALKGICLDTVKFYAKKGLCLKKLCPKGIMPYDSMPNYRQTLETMIKDKKNGKMSFLK